MLFITDSKSSNHFSLNPLNAELSPIRHLLPLEGAHHFVDVSGIRVNTEALSPAEMLVLVCQNIRRYTQ
jgi:hypothetical protein